MHVFILEEDDSDEGILGVFFSVQAAKLFAEKRYRIPLSLWKERTPSDFLGVAYEAMWEADCWDDDPPQGCYPGRWSGLFYIAQFKVRG